MRKKQIFLTMGVLLMTMGLAGCGSSETAKGTEASSIEVSVEAGSEATTEATVEAGAEASSESTETDYYLNEQGYLVDKVEEFKTETFGDYTLQYPILNDGVDEVVVYEFDTQDGIHIIVDASNVYQQTNLDQGGDYGAVELETVATVDGVVYMFDGERYYIEDSARNIVTITNPMNAN